MKTRPIFLLFGVICILAACQTETPPSSRPTTVNGELVLAPGQSAAVDGTDLTITFISVLGDERCPSDVECVASGPVTVSLSVQQGTGTPQEFTLQTFTDLDGRSPNVQFEGVTNRAEVGNYVLQITGVTPYPTDSTNQIEPSAYRLALLVSAK